MAVVDEALKHEVQAYLAEVLAGMTRVCEPRAAVGPLDDERTVAEALFALLTSRAYCYLSRTKVEPYREETITLLRRRMRTGGPCRFFYDIGPGYHATLRPGALPLRFDVGLSELFILSQASSLCHRVVALYPPGARFWLVIDNLCGLRTNDIPLERSEEYVRQLRRLIHETGVSDVIDLIVESEEFELEEYDRLLAEKELGPVDPDPSPEAVGNVARFLGRPCSTAEAAARIELYSRTGAVTETLMDRLVRGVHMTQRATGATLGFRPVPGGDQRTQAGEVVLTRSSKGRLQPLLLTSRNVDAYDCVRLKLPGFLPPPLTHVTSAVPR